MSDTKFGVGRWRTRDGLEAVIEFRTAAEDTRLPLRGYVALNGTKQMRNWSDDGRFTAAAPSKYDLVAPWYDAPTQILDPATSPPELLQQYKDAVAAGMKVERRGKNDLIWINAHSPNWDQCLYYRPAGTDYDVPPPVTQPVATPVTTLTADDVRAIVREELAAIVERRVAR